MTDVNDNKGGLNAVTHEKVTAKPLPGGSPLTFLSALPQHVGSYQYEWSGDYFLCSNLIADANHLGTLSGIKSLAVARIPAYDRGAFEGYIALREATELSNSMALRASLGLAKFAANVVSSLGSKSKLTSLLSRESKEALEFLKRNIRTKNPRDAWNTFLSGISVASNANMEWKYGWKPMIADMQSVAQSAQTIVNYRERLLAGVRVYGHATDTRIDGISHVSYIDEARLGSDALIEYQGERTTVTHATASIVRALRPGADWLNLGAMTAFDSVMEINGLNPSGKRLWQLLPLSFISDWFWNVSQVLESLQVLKAPISGQIYSKGGMYSEKRVTNVSLTATTKVGGIPDNILGGSALKTTYTRQVDSLEEIPTLYVPPITVPTDAGKWLSMAQIAFQRMLKG